MSQNVIAHTTPIPLQGESNWLDIPKLAWHLLKTYWPQLFFWFFAQRVAYDLCMSLSVVLASRSPLLGYVGISSLVLVQLITTAMMFIIMRPSLPALSRAGNAGDWLPPARPWTNSLSAALLPFFAFYVAWGLLELVKKDFQLNFLDTQLADLMEKVVLQKKNIEDMEDWRNIMSLKGLWIAVVIAGVVRYFAKWRLSNTGKLRWALLATLCEAYWVFIGVTMIATYVGMAKTFWYETRFWNAVTTWWENPFVFHIRLDGLKAVVTPLWTFIRSVAGAVLLPLVWLAITAIIYGLDLRKRQRISGENDRIYTLTEQYQNSHFLVKRFVGKISAGWDSKGVPVLNSIRLLLRAGIPALVILCVGWQLLAFLDGWGWRMAVNLIGPHDRDFWESHSTPIKMLIGNSNSLRPALFTQVLRVVLLAAVFDRAVAHVRDNAQPANSVTST